MSKYLSPKLETVTPYTPGEQPQDQQYIKLNTNESPYLPSPAVVAAVSEHEVEKLRLYSDPACTDLLKTAAVHFGLQPDQIMPGNGSDENLFRPAGLLRRDPPPGLCRHHLWLLQRLVRADAHPQPYHPAEGGFHP